MSSDCLSFDTNYRSTFDIVWSCLTIIIASSWLCVHPNVTGHSTTMWQRLRERLALFSLAIFAPELLAIFSFYQWLGCQRLYRKFKERAEGLGIPILLDSEASASGSSDTTKETNESEELLNSANHGGSGRWNAFRGPREGIGMSFKALARAVLSCGTDPQKATWSYTHAHFVQMGGIAFRDDNGKVGFKKPDHWTDEDLETFFAMNISKGAITDKSKAGALAKTLVVAGVVRFLLQVIARKAQGLPIALLEVAALAFITFNFVMYICWWNKPLDVEFPVEIRGVPGEKHALPGAATLLATNILMGHVDAIPIGSWIYSPKKRWYPRLYSFGKRQEVLDSSGEFVSSFDYTLGLTIAVTSSCFGVFHTVGWYLPAPTQVERILWRASCLVLTLYPFAALTVAMLVILLKDPSPPERFCFMCNYITLFCLLVIMLLAVLSAIAYVGARLTIMFLPFFELRDLPPLVHRTVSWSKFFSPV